MIDHELTTAFADVGLVGPILFLRGMADGAVALTALVACVTKRDDPTLRTDAGPVEARLLRERAGMRLLAFDFTLPARTDATYTVDGITFPVNAAFDGDLRIAFVSCNGQEHADSARPLRERNALWQRLGDTHARAPFQMLLQGGDQIYADELLDAHPLGRAWESGEVLDAPAAELAELTEALRDAFTWRYVRLLMQPQIAAVVAHVPQLCIWDDHDIVDGWGSLAPEKLASPIGRAIFAVARDHFLLFQMGTAPGEVPPIGFERTGASLGWAVTLPGLTVIAPDLRSERQPNRVMDTVGWRAFEEALAKVPEGRVLVISSVPALGPRLSVAERVVRATGLMAKYADDLRDQWQSFAHRAEWARFLDALAIVHRRPGTRVSVLSGEIHVATQGTLDVPPEPLRQLVSSGVTHPAPPAAYGRCLGLLARLRVTPLPGCPIRMEPLPGQRGTYVSQRNYLVLERTGGDWSAFWELEDSGATARQPL